MTRAIHPPTFTPFPRITSQYRKKVGYRVWTNLRARYLFHKIFCPILTIICPDIIVFIPSTDLSTYNRRLAFIFDLPNWINYTPWLRTSSCSKSVVPTYAMEQSENHSRRSSVVKDVIQFNPDVVTVSGMRNNSNKYPRTPPGCIATPEFNFEIHVRKSSTLRRFSHTRTAQ